MNRGNRVALGVAVVLLAGATALLILFRTEAAVGIRVSVVALIVGALLLTVLFWEHPRYYEGRARSAERPDHEFYRHIDDALASATAGRFAFDPPAEMRQGSVERVTVALIRSMRLDDALVAQLHRDRVRQLVDIRTSAVMAVQVRGEAFAITPLSEWEQPVGQWEATCWEFDVRALRWGRHKLTVMVTLRLPVLHYTVRRSVPVLERTILIRVAPVYACRLFLQENWKWMIATAVAIVAMGTGVAAWLKVL